MGDKIRGFSIKLLPPTLIFVAVYLIIKYAFWMVFPFVFAFIVAYIIRKIVGLFIKVTGLNIKEASIALLLICLMACFVALYFLINFLIREFVKLAENLPIIYTNQIEPIISDFITNKTSKYSFIIPSLNEVKNIASAVVLKMSETVAKLAINIPEVLITVTVTIIATFLLCIDYDNIKKCIMEFLPLGFRIKIEQVERKLILSTAKLLRCYLIIFGITFIELFIGLKLFGVRYSIVISLLIAFADFLPLIGTGTILIPWAIISYFSGKSAFSIGLISLYLIITIVRNIIEPQILGKNIGIHPLLTLSAMYIGLKLGGFLLAFMLPFYLLVLKSKNNKHF